MSSEPERSNRTAAYFDYQMGRRPSQAPAHLSRVLYIPRHYDNTVHLPIYEVGHRYRDAVQGCLLGSTVYTTTLGSMETPHGDRMEDQAVYLADIRRSEEEDVEIHLCKRELASRGEHVDLNMTSNSFDDTSAVTIKSGEGPMKMSTSFPIANSTRGRKSIKHPYFALTGLNTTTEKPGEHVPYVRLEWQIDPKDGILRYTLYRIDETVGKTICAIYHHKHWELSLSLTYSEGVLLLPDTEHSLRLEGIVVASLLGVLVQLRKLDEVTSNRRGRGWGCLRKMIH